MQPGGFTLTPQVQQPQSATSLANIMSAPSSLSCSEMSTTPTCSASPLNNGNANTNNNSQLPFWARLQPSQFQLTNQNSQQLTQQPQMPVISRQNDALSLDTIAVALHELEQLSWNKRSLSVNSADLAQVRMTSGSDYGGGGSSLTTATPLRYPSLENKRPQQTPLGQRRSCEPPCSPPLSDMRPPPFPLSGHVPSVGGCGGVLTSSPISSTFGFYSNKSPPVSFSNNSTTTAALSGNSIQQRRSALSSSVPGSLDSYQIDTETVDSGLGNDSSFFLLPTTSNAPNPKNNSASTSSSQLLRHSAYQAHAHSHHRPQMVSNRRPRASSTAAAGPTSRRHLFYCRHHLQARQKPYHFPASCVSALRSDNTMFNVSTGLPVTGGSSNSASASQQQHHAMYYRYSCSISSQSRSITPGSSPTRSSEADSLIPVAPLMRSRSLDDVHRSAAISSVAGLSSRPGHASANQSDLGQWDHEQDGPEQDDELTIMSGIVGWNSTGVQPPPPQVQPQAQPQQQTPQFYIRDWPISGDSSMLQ